MSFQKSTSNHFFIPYINISEISDSACETLTIGLLHCPILTPDQLDEAAVATVFLLGQVIYDLPGALEDLEEPVEVERVEHEGARDEHEPDEAEFAGSRGAVQRVDLEPVWRDDQHAHHQENHGHGQTVSDERHGALRVVQLVEEPSDERENMRECARLKNVFKKLKP